MSARFPIPRYGDRNIQLENLKIAVLKVMDMNTMLYRHLYSNIFDVPEYEKKNILYNSQLLDEQFQDYFTENFYNPDFKYHQSQLDIQILCNRRIRQNLREAREMYADRHNPWYSRKKFQTEKVFPDAVKLNLPKTLPMTFLCDHLLTVYHYMHDPQIAEVMNALVADENKSSATTDAPVVHTENSVNSKVAVTTGDEVTLQTVSVTKPKPEPVEKPTPKPVVKPTIISETDLVGQILLEGFGSSGKQPPSQWSGTSASTVVRTTAPEKSQTGTLAKPASTQNPSSARKFVSDIAAKLQKTKKLTGPGSSELKQELRLHKPAMKPSVESKTDLVCQILLHGLGSSEKQPPPYWPRNSGSTPASNKQLPAAAVRANSTNIQKPSSDKATLKETKKAIVSVDPKSTTKSRTAPTSVSWDMNKVLAPRAAEKRPRDVLDECVQEEMNAKRQRLAQWLGSCALKSEKKTPAAMKRKAALMEKSRKDHDSKCQQLGETKRKPPAPEPVKLTIKKSKSNWIINW